MYYQGLFVLILVNRIHTWLARPSVWFELDTGGTGTAVEGFDRREEAEMTAASIIVTAGSLDCRDRWKRGHD